jgi:hypothetical protein
MQDFLDLESIRAEMSGPAPSGRKTPLELADILARFIWESFSDFLADPETHALLARLGIEVEDSVPPERSAEELLIFHMWAHSRAVQLSFYRHESPALVKEVLDQLHRAIFEDMIANGTPPSQIPVFELRVSARYAEFYAAAEVSDKKVGEVALEQLTDLSTRKHRRAAAVLTERAIEVSNPLRDFLEGLELVPS